MDDILAELLRSTGRIEQEIRDTKELVKDKLAEHDRRLGKLERFMSKTLAIFTVLSFPLTYVYHRLVRKVV